MITEIGDLNSLFCYWYGTGKYRDISYMKIPIPNQPEAHIHKLWKDVWHSQQDQQKKIDQELSVYKDLIRNTSKEFLDETKFEENFEKYNIFQQITLVILFDQIPRNVFRKTAEAYQYDPISNKMVKMIIQKYKIIDELPIQFICMLLCCLNHAEVKEDHLVVETYLDQLKQKYGKEYYEIQAELAGTHQEHYYRILEYGRIPERNPYLGRQSTEKELIYLKSIS